MNKVICLMCGYVHDNSLLMIYVFPEVRRGICEQCVHDQVAIIAVGQRERREDKNEKLTLKKIVGG